jgi:hypothetical protein
MTVSASLEETLPPAEVERTVGDAVNATLDVAAAAAPAAGPAVARTAAAAPSQPPVGRDRYAIQQVLGQGGMGRVLLATDRQFGRLVALKELLPSAAGAGAASEGTVDRFVVEALVTGNLEHPGIPAVHDRGLTDGQGGPYYVMQRVQGQTLEALLDGAGSLAGRLRSLPSLIGVAQTVGFAHRRGVVHRDLKPANVVVGDDGQTWVIDWGIAKVRGVVTPAAPAPASPVSAGQAAAEVPGGEAALMDSRTREGAVVGTPRYMAPEQARGKGDEIDERTDVFALGCMLYHLLTGRPPFQAPTVAATLIKAARTEYEPVESLTREAPPGLVAICRRAMSPAPADRYRTAAELGKALSTFTAEAVTRKDPGMVGKLATLLSLLVLLGVAVATVFTTRVVSGFREQGGPAYAYVGFALVGCVLALLEWRTRGRYRLSPLCLACAALTLLAGSTGTLTGLSATLAGLGHAEGVAADAVRYRAILATGARESLGNIAIAGQLASLQILLWAMVRRTLPDSPPPPAQATAAPSG